MACGLANCFRLSDHWIDLFLAYYDFLFKQSVDNLALMGTTDCVPPDVPHEQAQAAINDRISRMDEALEKPPTYWWTRIGCDNKEIFNGCAFAKHWDQDT